MRRELLAGLSTFFTISYLILLYPKILSEGGIDFGSALTATILTMVASSLFLALYADFPALLVPGLSVGPYLVYSVILKHGTPWQTALGMVFWSGLIILLLTLFKIRQKILQHLPHPIKSAAISGIGLFLICVGLKDLGFPHILNVQGLIVLVGLTLFFVLEYFAIQGAFILTILASWILAAFFNLAHIDQLIALPPSLNPTFFKLNFLIGFDELNILVSIILIALFDTSASITVLSSLAHKVDKKGRIKNIDRILVPDGIGSMLAAVLGTGTLAYSLESIAGIKAGGRKKWTAITAAFCCLIGLFLYPLISSIPLFAITPVILAIGIFMIMEIKNIRWNSFAEAMPAVITLFTIPITFSIYQGFALGFVSYVLLKALKGELKEVHPISWTIAIIFAAHLSWALATNHF